MSNSDIEIKAADILRKVLNTKHELNADTSSEEINEWDSLKHIMLITEIEQEFGIKFELDDILGMSTFGEICKGIEMKISK